MPDNDLTQKQISAKYRGNLAYFARSHYLRHWRGWCFALAVAGSLFGAVTFRYWGSERVFSTGPISANHAGFEDDCRACHLDAGSDVLKALGLRQPSIPLGDERSRPWDSGVLSRTSLSLMDQACLQCHPTQGLHLPQTTGLILRSVSKELNVVHASSCAVCHREHAGHERMALPERQTCLSCHESANQLNHSRRSLRVDASVIAPAGENRDLGDGGIRYIVPSRPAGSLQPFGSFAVGHPAFGYERPEARDPADLKFNHARHAEDDLPLVNGRKLECVTCHQPGPGGVFYQKVNYEKHCQQCHSLQILPNLPNLQVPHGDANKVRYFLASLNVSVGANLQAQGMTDPAAISKRVDTEMQALRGRGLYSLADLENRVFYQGDPQEDKTARLARASVRKFLTECAKCHTVTPSDGKSVPEVHPPNIADRWVQRGPFTHRPHEHMACTDCHGAAVKSKLTSDILLPPQALCAECHRQPDVGEGWDPVKSSPVPEKRALAAAQRSAGGVKWDCQSCHVFHAPPDATTVTRTIMDAAEARKPAQK